MNNTMRAHLRLKTGLDFSGTPVERDRTGKGVGLSFSGLAGRVTELSGQGNLANLTLACDLILDAQREREIVAWITGKESSFYPPDAAERGIDLSALAVIRCPDRRDCARVADRLARSGAFGLLIVDLGVKGDVSPPLQSHLAGLARTHHMAVVFLTEKADEVPSLGSLISLRGRTSSHRKEAGRFICSFKAIKDKRRTPGWVREGVYDGTPGLC
ncbi:MAG: recombinase A [Syntrophorhabdaceae bacterium PtaU1.Bin034]|nr:MAG: recombinase A [Syntrophorhabdaceae bacterium PtaU1.Bin034]